MENSSLPFVSNRISYPKNCEIRLVSKRSQFFRPEKLCIESNGFNEVRAGYRVTQLRRNLSPIKE